MVCASCGSPNPDGGQFCIQCGRPLAAAAAPAPAVPTPAAPAPSAPAAPEVSGKAIASLVLGFLSCFLPAAIVAIVLGHIARGEIKRDPRRWQGAGMALGGLILGYIGLAFVPMMIIAAIAIPNLLRARQAANEASAVGNLRTINVAEVTYQTSYNQGFTCDLAALDGSGQGNADATHAQLIDSLLASGTKSGYRFELSGCEESSPEHYKVVAVPTVPNQSGTRAFCSDESGVIRSESSGSAEECLASGAPLQ
jgi:type IV pilus assembly protein PilA